MSSAHKAFIHWGCSHLSLQCLRVEACKWLSPSTRLLEIDSVVGFWLSLVMTWEPPGSSANLKQAQMCWLVTQWPEVRDPAGQWCMSGGEVRICVRIKIMGTSYEWILGRE
jgi:hypothetical protein